MTSYVPIAGTRRGRTIAVCVRAALLAALVIFGSSFTNREASAAEAAATANAGLGACGNNSGKALYDCVANVLDKFSSDITRANIPAAQSALHAAASQLRAVVSKVQALSAISQCRALIAGAIRQVRAIGSGQVPGWGGGSEGAPNLQLIVGVLSRAAQLIQSKG